jgi:MATE family multidrug resistance protein
MKAYLSILRLVWPIALGMVNNAIMQFVDRAYLAQDSMMALEAALPAGILVWLFAGFFQSVIGYSSVLVAQYHGANDPNNERSSYHAALMLAIISGILSLPIAPFGNWILSLSAPSEAVLELEKTYFTILMPGSFFIYAQTAAAAYFTGRGETRLIFWVNLAGNILNAVLDPFLIFGWLGCPKLGIAGAAYATIFSMAVQWIALLFAARKTRLKLREFIRPAINCTLRIIRFGVPAGLYSVLNCLSFAIFVFVTAGVGEVDLAVSNACFTVNYLLFAPMEGFALGASTLVAQAIGRGDIHAAATDARRTLILGVVFVAFASATVLLFVYPILSLFISADVANSPETLASFRSLGLILFSLMAAWQIFDATDIIVSGALKGAGDTKFVMGWMLFSAFVVWLPLVFIVKRYHNTMPALWSTMIAYVIVLCVGTIVRWRNGRWRTIKVV